MTVKHYDHTIIDHTDVPTNRSRGIGICQPE